MTIIVIAVLIYLCYTGYDYYLLPLEERFYHPRHDWFKPSGVYGHGIGILGTFMMAFGVSIYIARKRYGFMEKYLRLKYLLEFHIFLCVLGPLLVVFHTAFKFGGLVSIAFWCMVAVVASGVIGRFIYIQIPRTIEGRALSLNELKLIQVDVSRSMKQSLGEDDDVMNKIEASKGKLKEYSSGWSGYFNFFSKLAQFGNIKSLLKENGINAVERKKIIKSIKEELSLSNKIGRLNTMKELFKYWHVAHLPFALIMLIIVVVHVIVTLVFGYKWIF